MNFHPWWAPFGCGPVSIGYSAYTIATAVRFCTDCGVPAGNDFGPKLEFLFYPILVRKLIPPEEQFRIRIGFPLLSVFVPIRNSIGETISDKGGIPILIRGIPWQQGIENVA